MLKASSILCHNSYLRINVVLFSITFTFQSLQGEKERVMTELQQWHSKTKRLSMEKQNLSEATEEMKSSLAQIEAKTQKLLEDKSLAEERLVCVVY